MKGTFCGWRAIASIVLLALALAAAPAALADGALSAVTPAVQAALPTPPAPALQAALPATPAPPVVSGSVAVSVPAAPVGAPSAGVQLTTPVAAVSAKLSPVLPAKAQAIVSAPRAVPTAPIGHKAVVQNKPISVVVKAAPKQAKAPAKAHVPALRRLAATTTGPCAGFPMPPYNCTQMAFDGFVFNSCNAFEGVYLTGYFHDMASTSFDATTMTMTVYEHMNFQNVKGVGTYGNQYTSSDTTKDETTPFPIIPGLTLHVSTTHQEENNLISLGSDPNQIVHVTTTTEVDLDPLSGLPSGPPTVTVQGPGLKCTG